MRKTALATIVLAAGMALAQTSATPSTVQGCLSGANGNFTFTDQSGKSWTLTGSTDNLKDHVGNTVQITGNEDTTQNTISVSDIQDMSKGCNQASTSSSSGETAASSTAAGPEGNVEQRTTAQPANGTWADQTANPTTPADENPVAQNNSTPIPDSSANAQQPDYATSGTQTATTTQSAESTQMPQSDQAATSTSSTSGESVQGCLAGAMGSFTLTDQSGASWTLSGNTDQLQQHVGNTVQITGTKDTNNKQITVSNVTDVSQGCQQGSASTTDNSGTQQAATATESTTTTAQNQQQAADTTTSATAEPSAQEAPGTNSEDIRKNPAQSDIPSGQPQLDATNNPPTFGSEQSANTTSTTSTTAQTTQTEPATSTQQPSTSTDQSMTAQSQATTTEQPSTATEPSTSSTAQTTTEPSATEQNESAATEQNESAATQQNEAATPSGTQTESDTAAQGAATDQAAAKRGQLPQTASPLPLLLLLGFGSLAIGFFVFRRVKA